MGTGGPSRQSTPTLLFFAVSLDGSIIIPHLSGNCNPFFQIFLKKFWGGKKWCFPASFPFPEASQRGRHGSVLEIPKRGPFFLKAPGWRRDKKTAVLLDDCFQCWRKPIFPGRLQPSIFSAGELNFRVRDGNGWTLAAINTNSFVFAVSLDGLVIIPQPSGKCKPFFQKISKKFENRRICVSSFFLHHILCHHWSR